MNRKKEGGKKLEKENKTNEEIDMLDKIYHIRQEDMELENKQDRKVLEAKLNVVRLEEIESQIEDNLIEKGNNHKSRKEIINQIELLIENYEIQISYYNEKNYKQGFKDGLGLYNQCLNQK